MASCPHVAPCTMDFEGSCAITGRLGLHRDPDRGPIAVEIQTGQGTLPDMTEDEIELVLSAAVFRIEAALGWPTHGFGLGFDAPGD